MHAGEGLTDRLSRPHGGGHSLYATSSLLCSGEAADSDRTLKPSCLRQSGLKRIPAMPTVERVALNSIVLENTKKCKRVSFSIIPLSEVAHRSADVSASLTSVAEHPAQLLPYRLGQEYTHVCPHHGLPFVGIQEHDDEGVQLEAFRCPHEGCKHFFWLKYDCINPCLPEKSEKDRSGEPRLPRPPRDRDLMLARISGRWRALILEESVRREIGHEPRHPCLLTWSEENSLDGVPCIEGWELPMNTPLLSGCCAFGGKPGDHHAVSIFKGSPSYQERCSTSWISPTILVSLLRLSMSLLHHWIKY